MKIFIKTKPNSKAEKVEKISDNTYLIKVKAEAKEGKANIAVIKLLAKYFKVSQSEIKIKSGQTSKEKIVEIFT